jgi:hypothetical protein
MACVLPVSRSPSIVATKGRERGVVAGAVGEKYPEQWPDPAPDAGRERRVRPAERLAQRASRTIHVYRSERDRLADHWGVRDEVGALIQLGVVPAPTMAENVDA